MHNINSLKIGILEETVWSWLEEENELNVKALKWKWEKRIQEIWVRLASHTNSNFQ